MNRLKAAAVQMGTGPDKMENVREAVRRIRALREERPDFVVLPEMFCCPYQSSNFPIYAEKEGGEAWQAMADCAGACGVYLIAGSMPERDEEGRIFNTSYIFDRKGRQIGKHRKVHLFDINVQGGQSFKESDTLTAGDQDTVFETEFGTMGVMICYDIRFPEMARLTVNDGAKMIFVPAAFNMTTGPAHWELSFRARALDNQVYMMGCAPKRDAEGVYVSWGHSIITNPWGEVVEQLDEKDGVLMAQIDLDYEEQVRRQLPLLAHRRRDLYRLQKLKGQEGGHGI